MTDNRESPAASADRRVVLLRAMLRERLDTLEAARDPESPVGFTYPKARAVFETKLGEERATLENMADMGLLERAFLDKVHLCNACGHHALNFREICPQCATSNIDIVDMVHHYRCGHIGPETEFDRGSNYTCPKCEQKLRHIGVDYERTTSNYLCRACAHIFTEPKVDCRCFRCDAKMAAENVTVRTLYEYRITAKGTLVAASGRIESDDERGLLDADVGVYRFAYFEERLAQEIAAARRHKRHASVVFATIDHFSRLRGQYGDVQMVRRLRELADLTRESLRESDCAALYGQNTLALLLTDTAVDGARVVAERVRSAFASLPTKTTVPACTLSAVIVAAEEFGANEVIGKAKEMLRLTIDRGGNKVSQ